MPANEAASLGSPRLLTLPEVARELRVSTRHVAALVARGAIGSIRIGRCRRVPRAELERVIATGLSSSE